MDFLVMGQDAATFDYGPNERHEEHQAYMDSWSDRLVARGPLLSDDGTRHVGSLHLVSTTDLASARRFALEEPYARAGWYAGVTVSPFVSCLAGTMWDRPAVAPDHPSSFVYAAWAAPPAENGLFERLARRLAGQADPAWLFAGILLDDAARPAGLAGAVDLPQDEAADRIRAVLTYVTGQACQLTTHRWARGGRSQP
jgi:uncharacterized protein YciI